MLIVALVLAVIGLAALVTAVVTSNELIAWVCIGASVIGVLLLIVDALRERSRGTDDDERDVTITTTTITTARPPRLSRPSPTEAAEDYPDEPTEVVYRRRTPSTVESRQTRRRSPDRSSEAKRD